MSPSKTNSTVSLTINTCVTDVPFLEKTLRHIFRSLDYPFKERLIVVDTSLPKGHFQARRRGELSDLQILLNRMCTEGLIDRVEEIRWEEVQQKQVYRKYFGHEDIDARCMWGTAVYQYLFALEQCSGDYILHLDSDMLFYCKSGGTWINASIALMGSDESVMFTALAHPPRAQSVREFISGKPTNLPQSPRWSFSQDVSTRCFLCNRKRLEQTLLPFSQAKPGERLEESMTHTLKRKGYTRGSFFDLNNWAIHPKPHNDNFIKHLDNLIWAVEHNVFPFRRRGRYPWDLYTYKGDMLNWRGAIWRTKAFGKMRFAKKQSMSNELVKKCA